MSIRNLNLENPVPFQTNYEPILEEEEEEEDDAVLLRELEEGNTSLLLQEEEDESHLDEKQIYYLLQFLLLPVKIKTKVLLQLLLIHQNILNVK